MTDPSRTAVILKGGARTPIGRFLGGLSPLPAPELGAIAVRAAVDRAGVDVGDVDEVIMGNVVSAGSGQAPARGTRELLRVAEEHDGHVVLAPRLVGGADEPGRGVLEGRG